MLFLPAVLQTEPALTTFAEMRRALATGEEARVAALFLRPEDAGYLFRAAKRSAPLPRWRVNVIPSPPGWESTGEYWAVFHTRQPIEQDHDPVYPLLTTPQGFRLGSEIPETTGGENRIVSAEIDVHLLPKEAKAEVKASLRLEGKGSTRADVLRLQDVYAVSDATVDGKPRTLVLAGPEAIPRPKAGDFLHAGSLLIPWSRTRMRSLRLGYSGILREGDSKGLDEDKVDEGAAYVTAWWVPSTARLPFTTETRVTGPKGWTIRSEGVAASIPAQPVFAPAAREQLVAYRCDVPISFPKVVAGRYVVAASLTDRGRTFRAYHLGTASVARAERDVRSAAAAVAFFEDRLGPFPFPGYDVFDADTYYGIESYSYTLLKSSITSWATSHEIGHTYFGGLAPCPYVRDSWNEGMTQYVDSVLFKNDSDGTLAGALRQIGLHRPLTELPIPYEDDDATYYRGAYAMTMLQHEIGLDAVLSGLRRIVIERRGKDTGWPELRAYFEKASGKDLLWFWDQWISGTEWPKVSVASATVERLGAAYRTRIAVVQSGTAKPLRLRFPVRVSGHGSSRSFEVTMSGSRQEFQLTTDFPPDEASLDILGYVFGTVGPKMRVAL